MNLQFSRQIYNIIQTSPLRRTRSQKENIPFCCLMATLWNWRRLPRDNRRGRPTDVNSARRLTHVINRVMYWMTFEVVCTGSDYCMSTAEARRHGVWMPADTSTDHKCHDVIVTSPGVPHVRYVVIKTATQEQDVCYCRTDHAAAMRRVTQRRISFRFDRASPTAADELRNVQLGWPSDLHTIRHSYSASSWYPRSFASDTSRCLLSHTTAHSFRRINARTVGNSECMRNV